jgi:hypothetical protein
MRIMANNSGLSGCDKFYAFWGIFSLICTLASGAVGGIKFNDAGPLGMIIVLVPAFYFILLLVSCCMPATRYLCNLVEQPKLKAKIEEALESEPDVNYYI